MKTLVIDQSASEPRLHRALYFVVYLRAMVLNFFLVFVATMLFVGAGIEGVYFLADSAFDGLKPQMDQFGAYFVLLIASLFALFLIAFLV